MSNLQDWEASLGEKNQEPQFKKRTRTKSADLSTICDSEIKASKHVTHHGYSSDHTSEFSLIAATEGYRSETSENDSESGIRSSKEIKTVGKLRRTLSEKFRRENRIISTPNIVPVNDTIHKAIRQNSSTKNITKLLKKTSHIDQTDSKGQSCLHLCASRGHNDLCKLLLKRNANINFRDLRGFTPLHCASIEKHLNTCLFLLSYKGIDVTVSNNENSNALHYLVRIQVTEENIVLYRNVLDTLITKGIDINGQNSHGEAPIHFACMTSNIHTVAFLLERGADCNIKTRLGETPLHYSIRTGCIKLVRILMENGADPTIKAEDGSTAVDVAEQYQCTDILDCLQAIIEEEIECQGTDKIPTGPLATSTESTARAGWLVTNTNDKWEKCWAVISRQRIICYHDETKMGECIVKVLINGSSIIKSEDEPKIGELNEQLFCFIVTNNDKSTSFATKTPEEREGWVDVLKETVLACAKLNLVYEKLKQLSKPRKRLRARERNYAYHNCQDGISVLSAAVKSGSQDETIRLLLLNIEGSAAALSEIIDPDDEKTIRTFVKFFLHHNVLLDFLKACVSHDIRKTTMGETLFREMSLATRMLSIYLEMDEGREYLKSVALELVSSISSINHSLEVNPNNVGGGERVNFKANLLQIIDISQLFLDKVLSSASRCPLIFRELMLHTKQRVDFVFPNMTHAVVGGFVFLRFLCPAIVTPHKYGLLSKPPDKNSLRICVLITKLLQSVSNGIEFDGSKEDYMLRLNPFIKRNRLYVNVFFDNLTNPIGIEKQRSTMGKRYFQLPKDELLYTENHIFTVISNTREKMISLLTPKLANKLCVSNDSDDENTSFETNDVKPDD